VQYMICIVMATTQHERKREKEEKSIHECEFFFCVRGTSMWLRLIREP
jgi:hypothetical protein